jgi:hypothetical protein
MGDGIYNGNLTIDPPIEYLPQQPVNADKSTNLHTPVTRGTDKPTTNNTWFMPLTSQQVSQEHLSNGAEIV